MLKAVIKGLFSLLLLAAAPVAVQAQTQGAVSDTYTADELVKTGQEFFGSITEGLASVVERAVSQYGLPNAYILGQEGSGAFFGGVRYGDGTMYTRNAGNSTLYWQGPTVGFDVGADGSKVMMLVYNLPSVDAIYGRYPGVDGSAYMVGGLGMTVMKYKDIYIVPIRSGLGARLGVNMGYLKFTDTATWNPF
ncbi:MAG TPA: DUF1134 domain-containing protein [Devosiaceae bacterium]